MAWSEGRTQPGSLPEGQPARGPGWVGKYPWTLIKRASWQEQIQRQPSNYPGASPSQLQVPMRSHQQPGRHEQPEAAPVSVAISARSRVSLAGMQAIFVPRGAGAGRFPEA